MTIIRESHASLLSRHDLNVERRRIMTLDIDPNKDPRLWNNMKRYVN
jgi:hypothetical protein